MLERIEILVGLHLLAYSHGQLQLLQRVAQPCQSGYFFALGICNHNKPHHLAGKIAQIRSQGVFVITREMPHAVFDIHRHVERFFIYGQMFILRHEKAAKNIAGMTT